MKLFFTLILGFLLLQITFAQHHHVCGTGIAEQQLMDEKFRADLSEIAEMRGDVLYIPVKFHLVGKNDGKGKVGFRSILNQLNILNRDYAIHNFKFYLKDGYNFGNVNNTTIYDNPRDNESTLKTFKDPKALNVFIVNTIGNSGLNQIILGYYSPSNDFVVVMKSEVDKTSNTLSHEVGHFFNLRHTFYGWEEEPYDEGSHGNPLQLIFAPGTNIQIEKVDKSNCTVGGDNVCDTPPDYHFDINYATTCVFTKIVMDYNSDTIRPMLNNQMSYFSDCGTYEFTLGQENRMRTNYASNARSYIRSNYTPNIDTLPTLCPFIWPEERDTAYVYTSVDFTWEDQNADYYMLEIQNALEYYVYFTTTPFYNVTELKPKKQYFASIRAFNDGYTGTATTPIRFFTGDLQTSTQEVEDQVLKVYPNPVYGNKVYFTLENGQEVKTVALADASGKTSKLNFEKEANGVYSALVGALRSSVKAGLLIINTNDTTFTKKIVLE